MPNVYIEPRPKGRPEGSHIEDFVLGQPPEEGRLHSRINRVRVGWDRMRVRPI